MDIRELKMFITVATELNFRAAAQKLHISQPPLTRAITKLEEELEIKLFHRTTRKVELTPAGMALLKDAKDILNKVNGLKISLDNVVKLKKEEINIGITTLTLHSTAIKSIWKFRELNPKFNINIVEAPSEEQLVKLSNNDIDIAIIQADADKTLFPNRLFIDQDALGVIVPQGHKLYKNKSISMKSLKDETLIIHDKSEKSVFTNAIKKLFETNKISIKYYYRKKQENCCALTATGKGLMLTTKSMAKFALANVKYIPLNDTVSNLNTVAYWMKDDKPITKLLISFLENQKSIKTPKSACLLQLDSW